MVTQTKQLASPPAVQPLSGVRSGLNAAYLLSAVVAALMVVASAGGLLIEGIYRDESSFVLTAWFANDLVTLGIASPIFVAALVLAMRGSLRAQLVWLGMLDYTLYNFAFYLFGAVYNRFFLIYVALFVLSIFALIFGLVKLDVKAVQQRFRAAPALKWISGYMAAWALILGSVWVWQSLAFVSSGQVPQVGGSEEVFRLIATLDLSLVIPFVGLAAIWLWQHRPWGRVLAVIVNVKGLVYTLVLIAGDFIGAAAGIEGAMELVWLWIFFASGSLLSTIFLLRNVQANNILPE
jgi:hypothetical protein